MPEENKKQLEDIAKSFNIGKNSNPQETIKLLERLNFYNEDKAINLVNYFVTIEANPDVLMKLLKFIQKFNNKSSVNCLIDLLLFHNDSLEKCENKRTYDKVRSMAAKILGNLKDNNAVDSLLYVLNNSKESYKLRLDAADALGRIGDIYAVPSLINVASNEKEKSVYVRESAVKALGLLGDIRAIDPFIKILEKNKAVAVKFNYLREQIVRAIGRLGSCDDRTIRALEQALSDESPHVRVEALEALSQVENERIKEIIEPFILDKDETVARTAICALYDVAGRECLEDLLQKDDLPSHCKDEIILIFEEEDEEDV